MIRTIAAIAMTLFIGSAIAEEAAAPAKSAFAAAVESYDADKDGNLSQDEIAKIDDKVAAEALLALDANKDGSIDAMEGEASK